MFILCVCFDLAGYTVCVCVCVCVHVCIYVYLWIHKVHTEAPTERIHSSCSFVDPQLPLHHPPSILFSIAPFIPVLIPLSNPSLSFHLRSNNISNSYSHPAIPPMAISATALEIFNTLYPQFGWVILKKFFFFLSGWRRAKACAITWCLLASLSLVFSLFFLLFLLCVLSLLLFLSLSQMNRPIQVKPADSESRGGTVCPSFLPSFPSPLSLLPSLFCSSPTNMLPARISLTIICPIRRCPVPRRRLTTRSGRTFQYSEHIM